MFNIKNFTQAANLSRSLSSYLLGNWSENFDEKLGELRAATVTLNSTRVDLAVAQGLSGWLSAAENHLKEWAGMGALAGVMLVAGTSLWLICRMQASRRQEKTLITQALMVIEDVQSSMIWLAALNEQKY